MPVDQLLRCHHCRTLTHDALLALSANGRCWCGGNRFSPATAVSDEEMARAIQQGYKYEESNFYYVEDKYARQGIFPHMPWADDSVAKEE